MGARTIRFDFRQFHVGDQKHTQGFLQQNFEIQFSFKMVSLEVEQTKKEKVKNNFF